MTFTEFIEGRIRRSNRTVFMVGLVTTALLVFGIITAYRFWSYFAKGPYPMTAEQVLNSPVDVDPVYRAKIKGDQILANVGTQTKTEDGKTSTTGYFSGLVVGDRLLLILTPGQIPETQLEFVGSLATIPADIHDDIVNAIVRDYPDLKGVFLPLMLTSPDDTVRWQNGLMGIVVLIVFGLMVWFVYIRRVTNYRRHPIMKGLARYGDPYQVVDSINIEWKPDAPWTDGLQFTRHWMLYNSGDTFEAVRRVDMMWFYEVTVKQYGVITSGRFITLMDRHGRVITLRSSGWKSANKETIVRMMETMSARAPWAIVGHSAPVQKAWNERRADVIAMVDKRRAQFREQMQAAKQ